MLWPHLILLRLADALWQAAGIRTVCLQVNEQVIIGAAITAPPVIDSAGQFPRFATSMLLNQARMI